MRAAVDPARRQVICRSAPAINSHRSGAGTIIISAVAFTAPTLATTSAAERGMTPTRPGRRGRREADDPTQAGPGQQHGGRPRDIGQQVGRELVHERGHRRGEDAEPEAPGRPQDAGARDEHERADPEPVGHPVGEAGHVAQPVPRPLGPQVGDHLVGDPTPELAGVDGVRRVADEPGRIQVEVQLGVGRHPARGGGQCGDVGQQGQHADGQPQPAPANGLLQCHQRTGGSSPERRLSAPSAPARAVRRCGDVAPSGPGASSSRWARNQS